MSAIGIDKLVCHQGRFQLAVDEWQLAGGEFEALLGCNGAGKSTLLRVLAGELQATGNISLHGSPVSAIKSVDRARHLAVLPQASQLSFGFSAAEVVALGSTPLSLSHRQQTQAVRHFMRLTDCDHLANTAYPRLSGGERQRVHLARVLLQLSQAERTPVLLLDEPTSAQDLGQQRTVLRLVRSLCDDQGYAVVAVLHDLNQALRYAHRCTVLDGGRIVACGTPASVLNAQRIREVWNYPAEIISGPSGVGLIL